jgi:hypothetical protein
MGNSWAAQMYQKIIPEGNTTVVFGKFYEEDAPGRGLG